MQGEQSVSRATQAAWGLPQSLKFVGPFPFAGMDSQASRIAIQDNEAFWMENLVKIGDGNLRAVPDLGPALYTVPAGDPRKIISFAWFNIGLTNYVAIFFDDGSAYQIGTDGSTRQMATPGSSVFYHTNGAFPATVGWGGIYLLIANNNTSNDYWAWDGTVLYGAGSIGPQVTLTSSGANYVGVPNITVVGGSGSGVVLSPTIENGSVTSVQVVSPGGGYTLGDTVQAIFSGGGGDNGAYLSANLAATSVNQVVVLARGHSFTSAPTVVFAGGGGGAGAAATATVAGGQVTGVTVTAGGSGYTVAPTVSFTGGGGTGAQAQATLVNAGVESVTVVQGGTNFFGVPQLTFRGGFGSGASATAILSGPGPIVSITIPPGGGGDGYTTLPVVTITDGGAGTGATAIVSSIQGGVIQSILLTAPGADYTAPIVTIDPPASGTTAIATAAVGAGSIASVTVEQMGSGYTTAPAVIVQSGLNTAASATLQLMPFGVSGTSIETFDSQVWVQDPFPSGAQPTGGVRNSSAPGSISDFATSDGGLQETVTDRFLRRHLTVIRQSNGFLYPMGDSSVGVISNVQVQGNPPLKTLTNQNTDPQTGTHWRDTVQDFSRTILFANKFGIFGLFGGAVTKISAKMDGVFASALFPDTEYPAPVQPVMPSAAVANLYNRKVYLLLMSVLDPFTLAHRPAMVCWTEQDWSIVSQRVGLSYIGTQEINSNLVAWGTDGTALWPLMQTPSSNIPKTLSTKLYGAAQAYMTKLFRMLFMQAENFANPGSAPAFNVTVDTEWGSLPANEPAPVFPPPLNAATRVVYRVPAGADLPPVRAPVLAAVCQSDMVGMELGLTITTAEEDFAIYNLILAHEDNGPIFG